LVSIRVPAAMHDRRPVLVPSRLKFAWIMPSRYDSSSTPFMNVLRAFDAFLYSSTRSENGHSYAVTYVLSVFSLACSAPFLVLLRAL